MKSLGGRYIHRYFGLQLSVSGGNNEWPFKLYLLMGSPVIFTGELISNHLSR